MKVILGLLLFLCLVSLWFIRGFSPTQTGMQICLDQATQSAQTDLSWLAQNQPTRQDMCARAQTQYQELSECYTRLFHRYFIPPSLIETLMIRTNPNYPVRSRNQAFLDRACAP